MGDGADVAVREKASMEVVAPVVAVVPSTESTQVGQEVSCTVTLRVASSAVLEAESSQLYLMV